MGVPEQITGAIGGPPIVEAAGKELDRFSLKKLLGLDIEVPKTQDVTGRNMDLARSEAQRAEARKRRELAARSGFESTFVSGGMGPLNLSTAPTLLGG